MLSERRPIRFLRVDADEQHDGEIRLELHTRGLTLLVISLDERPFLEIEVADGQSGIPLEIGGEHLRIVVEGFDEDVLVARRRLTFGD
jgi:hypothetical protein